jgi:hypothetical protein
MERDKLIEQVKALVLENERLAKELFKKESKIKVLETEKEEIKQVADIYENQLGVVAEENVRPKKQVEHLAKGVA